MNKWSKPLFWACLAGSFFCSPAVALFAGIAYEFLFMGMM